MRRFMFSTLLGILVMSAGTAQAHDDYVEFNPTAPKVRATVRDHQLMIHLPPDVRPGSVTFKIHGFNVNKRVMRRHRRAFSWNGNVLTVDMRPFHRRHGQMHAEGDRHLWVWGHLNNGNALLQVVHVDHN